MKSRLYKQRFILSSYAGLQAWQVHRHSSQHWVHSVQSIKEAHLTVPCYGRVFFKWGMDFLLVRSLLAFNLQHITRELWKILKVSGIAGRPISESRHWTLHLPRQCHEMRNFPGRFLENPRDCWVCWEDCRLLQTCILDHFCRALNAEITTIRVCPQLWLWVSLHYTLCSSGKIRFIV